MRAGLPQREPECLKKWTEEARCMQKLVEQNEGKPRYTLHDGPPFSNGIYPHGYRDEQGPQGLRQPLQDDERLATCHMSRAGTTTACPLRAPIIKKQKLDRKKMTMPEFRACLPCSLPWISSISQLDQFVRLGVLADSGAPLPDHGPGLRGGGGQGVRGDVPKGLHLQGAQAGLLVPPRRDSPGRGGDRIRGGPLYFHLCRSSGSATTRASWRDSGGDLDKTYFVIWTTTTWTLPGNLAICLGPDVRVCACEGRRREILYRRRSRCWRDHEGCRASGRLRDRAAAPSRAASSNI